MCTLLFTNYHPPISVVDYVYTDRYRHKEKIVTSMPHTELFEYIHTLFLIFWTWHLTELYVIIICIFCEGRFITYLTWILFFSHNYSIMNGIHIEA